MKRKRLFLKPQAGVLLLTMTWALSGLAQEPHPFGGFTVMETTNEEIHQATGIGVGFRDWKPTLLMTLIAGDRGYASLTKGNDLIWPNCMTWVRKDEEKAGQIVAGKGEAWGLYHAGLKIEKAGPVKNICGEFSLQRMGPKQAVFIKGNLRVVLPIIENFPVVSIDWSNPALSHFRIDGFGLGPISRREFSNIYGRPEQSRIAAEHPLIGRLKNFGYASLENNSRISVRALADLDSLFTEGETEIVRLSFTNTMIKDAHLGTEESFIEAMLERYGAPSMVLTPPPGQLQLLSHMSWIWAHDLHGRFLSEGEDSNNSCIKNLKNNSLGLRPPEYSHWSCGLVMVLSSVQSQFRATPGHSSPPRFVVIYSVLLFHGHAMAHHFFSDRLDVVEAAMRGEHLRNSNKPEIQPHPDKGRSRRGGRRQPN